MKIVQKMKAVANSVFAGCSFYNRVKISLRNKSGDDVMYDALSASLTKSLKIQTPIFTGKSYTIHLL